MNKDLEELNYLHIKLLKERIEQLKRERVSYARWCFAWAFIAMILLFWMVAAK